MPTLLVKLSMNSGKAKVIGFGALNLDRIFYVDRIVRPDEESFINYVENHPGGSAANTIVGLSRLGVPAGYIGKVADDEVGRILMEDLANENVNINGIRTARGRSGTCLIMVDGKGNRGILVDPGVNDTISMADIDQELVNSAKLIHITSFVCRDAEMSFETQRELAASTSAEISFDPGTLYAERGMEALEIFIRKARVILPSDRELTLMTGCRDIREGAEMLIDTGAKWVAVKRGEKGCYVTDGTFGIELPPQKVDVVDTTGAGDAFNVGFIYGMVQGKDIETCGKIGNITASISITKRGAREGLPYKEQLNAFIQDL